MTPRPKSRNAAAGGTKQKAQATKAKKTGAAQGFAASRKTATRTNKAPTPVPEHLGASRVLAVSPTEFPDNRGVLLAAVPADRSMDVDWLDDHDLLDPNIYLHHLSHPTATGERVGKPAGWETGYLDWARRSVVGPSA